MSVAHRKSSTHRLTSQNKGFLNCHESATEERTRKDDYDSLGGQRKKLNTVQALYEAGDINDDSVHAAERWLSDYLFAHMGYADFLNIPLPKEYIKGDIHTFNLSRGKASGRITDVRNALGHCAHIRLVMLLVQELSFSKMGIELYPNVSKSSARAKASAQCALLLEQLASFYAEQRKKRLRSRQTPPSQQNTPAALV